MRRILVLSAIAVPDLAHAHVGHLGELAGHSHWIALGALGIATVVGALAAGKGKSEAAQEPNDAQAEESDDMQDVPA
jgi:hypothetical protein